MKVCILATVFVFALAVAGFALVEWVVEGFSDATWLAAAVVAVGTAIGAYPRDI